MIVEAPERGERVRAIPVGRQSSRRQERSWLLLTLALMVAVAGLCVLYLLQTQHVVQLGYQLTQLQRERDQTALEAASLRYEIAKRQSLAVIEDLARREYGMVPVRRVEPLEVERPTWTLTPEPIAVPPVDRWQRLLDVWLGTGRAVAEGAR